MNNDEFETVFIKEEISKCEDIEDFKVVVFPKLHLQQDAWAKKVKAS